MKVAEAACAETDTLHNMPFEVTPKKVADAIIDGHPLRIEGGDFQICDGKSSKCGLGGCYKQEFYQSMQQKRRRYHENSSNI